MNTAQKIAVAGEALTGVALLVTPSLVGHLLFGVDLSGAAVPVARVAGMALIGLSIACLPGRAMTGLLTYSVLVTFFLAYLGLAGGFTGVALWPVVGLHVVLTSLLAVSWSRRGNGKSVA